jgi:hypothetical protein
MMPGYHAGAGDGDPGSILVHILRAFVNDENHENYKQQKPNIKQFPMTKIPNSKQTKTKGSRLHS